MTNLLVSFANFQLPEWLTFGSVCTGAVSVIGVIGAIIKLKASDNLASDRSNATVNLLSTITEKLQSATDFANTISQLSSKFDENMTLLSDSVSSQHDNNAKLAKFVYTAFSLSNLSQENKQKLLTLVDELFHDNNLEVIDQLEQDKVNMQETIDKYQQNVSEMTVQIESLKQQVESNTNTAKKRRSIQ